MGNTYRAFISYSHKDAQFARWLHARLETYRLPDEIARLAPAGEKKGRLGPIFRDREELPAAEDLSAAVRAALAVSEVLVVLCSPDARGSPWVAREIALFRELGPERPILAAIVRGEPGEAFPDALLAGREPLAADLRKRGDGRRLGFLKIVAGIAGVPLDTLVQRDAQRHLRRVTAVTLGTAAAALAMAVMTVVAIQARDEAERQRGEAVALATFMGADLHDSLRGVGRLELMTDVTKRARTYYSGQGALSTLPPATIEGLARNLHAMIELEALREDGNLAEAEGWAKEAYRATALLVRQEPSNADFVFDHAQSQYWRGYVFETREDYRAALPWYQAYDRSARRLSELEPGSPRTAMERGFGALNLGIVAFRLEGTEGQAVPLLKTAIGWLEQAVEREPSDEYAQQQLANAWSWLSNVHYMAGDYAAALAAQEPAARIKSALAEADPLNRDRLFDLLIARRILALCHLQLGRRASGLASLESLARETRNLSARDPNNSDWRYVADLTQADLRKFK